MGDVKPLTPADNDPSRTWAAAQSIEQIRRDREALACLVQKNPSFLLLAAFCAYIKNNVHLLLSHSIKIQEGCCQSQLKTDLENLYRLLVELSQADVSEEPLFVRRLSTAWRQLVNAVRFIELLERKENPFIQNVKFILNQIRSHPPRTEYTLGFYLEQSAGTDWHPFPLIEMLHLLHEESIRRDGKSYIHKWCTQLKQLMSESPLKEIEADAKKKLSNPKNPIIE